MGCLFSGRKRACIAYIELQGFPVRFVSELLEQRTLETFGSATLNRSTCIFQYTLGTSILLGLSVPAWFFTDAISQELRREKRRVFRLCLMGVQRLVLQLGAPFLTFQGERSVYTSRPKQTDFFV